jgi:hypothetical protein
VSNVNRGEPFDNISKKSAISRKYFIRAKCASGQGRFAIIINSAVGVDAGT